MEVTTLPLLATISTCQSTTVQSSFRLPRDLTLRNSGFSSHRFSAQTHRLYAAIWQYNTREGPLWRHHQSAPLLSSKQNVQSNHDNFILPNLPVVNFETTEKEAQESLHIWCLRFTEIPLKLWIQPFDRFAHSIGSISLALPSQL